VTRRAAAAALAALAAAALLLSVGPAAAGRGSIWDGIGGGKKQAAYRKMMAAGDRLTARAVELMSAGHRVHAGNLALRAADAYEKAADIDPRAAEPHYRAGQVLHAYFVSDIELPDRNATLRAIRHWDAFQSKAPRDPRLEGMLFNRAFTLTKLGGEENYRRAIADYAAELRLLDLASAAPGHVAVILSNKAEIHMALGELDQAIEHYYESLSYNPRALYALGLAVALDRDEQASKARELLDTYPFDPSALAEAEFFIPEGDVFWYLSLGHESLGRYESAVNYMRRYLAAQPRSPYAQRARQSLARLEKLARTERKRKGSPESEAYRRTWVLPP